MSEICPNNNIKTQFFLVYVKNLVNKFLAPLPEIRHYVMTRTKKYKFLTSLTKFDPVDQSIVGGAKLNFSRTNNFGLTETPFRRPRRYEFTDR